MQPRPLVKACFRNERTMELELVPLICWGWNPGEDPVPLVLDEEESILKDARTYRNFVRLEYSRRALKTSTEVYAHQ